MAKASKEEVEKAFTAGFNDKDIDLKDNAELEVKTSVAVSAAKSNEDLEKPLEENTDLSNTEKTKDEKIDEWDGVPEAMKVRFQAMEVNLTKVQNIANSASGRANKLQSLVDKKTNETPVEKPKPTSEQLLSAMTSNDNRDKLREDFPEFAVVFDEMDKSVSSSVGSAMDKLREEMREENKNTNAIAMEEFEIKRSLDIKHPGWENTVQDTEFKKWAYEGGPSEQESAYYDSLVFQANQSAPEESAALFETANTYFSSMMQSHPVWALEKGSLYGDSSGKAAISLLDLYVKDKKPEPAPEVTEPAKTLIDTRFEENLTPTSGRGRQAPAPSTDAVERAFSEGFNS